jgi:signal transduction histidine kinase
VTRRFIVSFLAIAVFILLVLELPLGVTYARQAEQQLLSRIERETYALSTEVEEVAEGNMSDPEVRRGLDEVLSTFDRSVHGRAVVVDATGTSVADSAGDPGQVFGNRPEFQAALAGRIVAGRRPSATAGTDLLLVAVPQRHDGAVVGAVRVTYPRSELDALVRANWYRLGALAVVVIGAVIFVGLVIARWATRPIRAIEAAAGRLADGDLGARVTLGSSPAEVSDLAAAFNEMAERNEDLVDRQRRFVADASHQLRTPLTALSLRLESVMASAEEQDPQDRALVRDAQAAEAEVARLAGIVEQMLALSRSGHASLAIEVDVRSVAEERTISWREVAVEQGRRLELFAAAHPLVVRAPVGVLEQILDNLIANALAYSPKSQPIEVVLATDGSRIGELPAATTESQVRESEIKSSFVRLAVVDHGPGLDPEELALAPRRFWRGPSSSTSPGSGLGLAIVESLTGSMGGSLELTDTPGGGLTVVVRIPAVG